MTNLISVILILFFLGNPGFAQEIISCCEPLHQNGIQAEYRVSTGKWKFSSPKNGIIKAVFQPENQIQPVISSNAVIVNDRAVSISITNEKDTMITFDKEASVGIKSGKILFAFDGKEVTSLTALFKDSASYVFQFSLKEQEQIFGGGERALPMNRRGYTFDFYNGPNYGYGEGAANLNFSVPFLISSEGYGIFFDNVSKGYADIGKKNPGILETGFLSGELNFYVIRGENVHEILQRFTQLTGTQDIPPRWALGAFVSRFGYRSEAQAREVIQKMQDEKFPMDAIIFDLFWFGDSIKGTMGNLNWVNREKWINPQKMISDFKNKGIKTILITEPFILNTTGNYQRSLPFHAIDSSGKPFLLTDFYFGKGGLLDLFRNDAQDWFWNEYDKQIKISVAGWWGDLGEPEKHPSALWHNLNDLGQKRLFSADEVHNLYGQYWSKMLSEKYSTQYPDVRLFHLNRSGFAGSQRFHAFPWTGDVGRNWSGLRAQLPVLLGMSICGIPYVHSDAGGFAMGEKDPELYTRWLQFAVFTPIFRPHGTALEELAPEVKNIESEPVFYPEPYKTIVRNYYKLRYAMAPYNYTLAYEQKQYGKPLMKPMFYYSHSNSNLLNAADQYFWGDAFLIAPVIYKNAGEKRIYFPEGSWYNWHNNKKLEGPRWDTVSVTMENIPVFVKEGSFVPLTDSLMNMDRYSGENLTVRYYYSKDASSFTLYEDDGKTNRALEKNQYQLIAFSSYSKRKKQIIEISDNGGVYQGKPHQRIFTFVLTGFPSQPRKLSMDGEKISVTEGAVEITGVSWDNATQSLRVVVSYDGTNEKIEIEY